jgi:hypothetical protein
VLNYNIWRNGDLVTVEHYSTVILTIDTVTKELVYAGGISPSDSDAINTVIAHYDIVNYRGRECFPYTSYSKTNSKVYVSTES